MTIGNDSPGFKQLGRSVGKLIILIFAFLMTLSMYNSIFHAGNEFEDPPPSEQFEVAFTSSNPPSPGQKLRRLSFQQIKGLPLTDPKIVDHLRRHVLVPPSTMPYAFSKEMGSLYKEQIQKMFGDKKDGFFIECGANDGEFLSNTLELEKRGWKGLLIEAQPELGKMLMTKNRKAWFANVCLSPYNNISEINFAIGMKMDARWKNAIGKLLLPDNNYMGMHREYGKVPCFPITTLTAAIGVTHVDYLSLDVEGVELKILKTLPFDDTLVID
ncbi:unnamed protein product, partial [Allacma fusca]